MKSKRFKISRSYCLKLSLGSGPGLAGTGTQSFRLPLRRCAGAAHPPFLPFFLMLLDAHGPSGFLVLALIFFTQGFGLELVPVSFEVLESVFVSA